MQSFPRFLSAFKQYTPHFSDGVRYLIKQRYGQISVVLCCFSVCNQQTLSWGCCAELFMSHVGMMTMADIAGVSKPGLWRLGTIVAFWLPKSSRSRETSLAEPRVQEHFSCLQLTTEELCSLKRKNSPEVHSYILKNSLSVCVRVLFGFLFSVRTVSV